MSAGAWPRCRSSLTSRPTRGLDQARHGIGQRVLHGDHIVGGSQGGLVDLGATIVEHPDCDGEEAAAGLHRPANEGPGVRRGVGDAVGGRLAARKELTLVSTPRGGPCTCREAADQAAGGRRPRSEVELSRLRSLKRHRDALGIDPPSRGTGGSLPFLLSAQAPAISTTTRRLSRSLTAAARWARPAAPASGWRGRHLGGGGVPDCRSSRAVAPIGSPSISMNWAAVCGRSAGTLAIGKIASSTSSGRWYERSGRSLLPSSAGPRAPWRSWPVKGGSPASISYSMQPRLYKSG